MRKLFLTITIVAILICALGQQGQAQPARVVDREAEWNHYALPQSTFVRMTDPDRTVLFQIPNEWKRQSTETLNFSGPHSTSLKVFIQKIPDGIPLRDYVSAIMQPLRSLPDGADSLVVRRTAMSGLEAREIMFDSDAGTAEITRRIIWCAVKGPIAFSVVLMTPVANVAEIEPYLKAIVQSVIFVEKDNFTGFEALRSSVIKDDKPTRLDEVQSLAASLNELDGSSRQTNISGLASIFALAPDKAIDLTLDGRPMVRAAAFEAIAESRNKSLEKFLVRALDDPESFVAERAARAIATNPNVIDLLRQQSLEWFKIAPLARVWPFLNRANQVRILEEIFAQPLLPAPSSKPTPKAQTASGKSGVTVRATVIPPGSTPPPVPLSPTSDPNRQVNALALVRDVPAADFRVPLKKILASKNDSLTTLTLQVSWLREEVFPVEDLLNLLTSDNDEIRRLAMLHLGQSGSVSDIKKIEAVLNKPVSAGGATPVASPASGSKSTERSPTPGDVQLAMRRINIREQLSTASGDARQQIIKKGLADPKLADWVWFRFVRESAAREQPESHPAGPLKVLPLGENIFPHDVTYYTALPEPGKALEKFVAALDGLQLESARSQASLVLILSVLREQLAQQLNSPAGASPITYSGINIKEPIALARWSAAGAPVGIPSAERRAIVLRVTDRARFERSLTLFQSGIGNFKELPDAFSGAVRFLTVLPATLPLAAKAMLEGSLKSAREEPLLKYNFVGGTEWIGYSIKVVEQRRVAHTGHITTDSAYLTYLGDTAVLTPDLDSLADVIKRASSEDETLATNPDFKRIVENSGEAIYLSNLRQVIADGPTNESSPGKDAVIESGALKISNSTWENMYQIQFPQSDWLRPFVVFQPSDLASPGALLPQTTVAYYFMNFDPAAGWRDWSSKLFSLDQRKDLASIWAIDFEKEVLPELGPECGVALLGLPDIQADNWELPWIAFFKLKTDKLQRALDNGKLLTGGSAAAGPTQIKLKSGELFVAAKNGFLVLSNNRLGIDALDHKEKLVASRDFSRAAKRAPAGVVAFGGYNLEAAIAAVGDSGSDAVNTQRSSLISAVANAFHSPSFYATATAGAVQGRFSLSMDREGRFSVSELSSLSKDYRLTYAVVEPRGVPIQNQERLSGLKLRIRATATGEIDRIKQDVTSAYQVVEKTSDKELYLKVLPRLSEPKAALALPIKGAEFNPYLQPGNEIRSDDKSVIEKARSIAGEEHDSWKVARKLADWVYTNIKWKRVDYATAPQTLATLEADCLEFSQLYVAMARSLGLPARVVSGMAYSGTAFGGHAWVEVYVGDWIEVDPTWGTAFVDATHIRNSADGALLTYASLNLVDFEILEAPRGIAEFQKDPRALTEKLREELPKGRLAALNSALDLEILTNESLGAGNWNSLSDLERELMTSGYRRVLMEISAGFREASTEAGNLQVLQVRENGEKAEAVLLEGGLDNLLIKFSFVRRNGAWFLTEILQTDNGLHIISETLQPSLKAILERRNNKSARTPSYTEFVRVLLAMQKDAKAAIAIADRALQNDPKNRGLRHLKALALVHDEKQDDAIQIWKELSNEATPFAPALLNLGYQYDQPQDTEKQKLAVEFFTRYGQAEPDDPRPHVSLAGIYEAFDDAVHAEAEHRAALKLDPANTTEYIDFAAFLAGKKRFNEAASLIDEADKKAGDEDDFFGDLMGQLYFDDDKSIPEGLALSQRRRMDKSPRANLWLAYVRLENGRSLQAIPLLKHAALLKKDWPEVYGALAQSYRKLRNWTAALNSAETAIKISAEYSDGHFQRACALARLGRIKAALQSLEKAVELDPDLPETIRDEVDLRVLASQPAFKKLLAGLENNE